MGKFVYQCVNCLKEYEGDKLLYLCPECNKENKAGEPMKGILKVIYNYESLIGEEGISFEDLKEREFIDILPINSRESLSPLKVGNTPLYKKEDNGTTLYFKYDALNPTFSFKDRASDVVSAVAKEHGIDTIVTASTGNAASSLAGICASQGQKAILFVPAKAPKAKLTQILMYGGVIVPVDGTYDDAFDLTLEAADKYGWYNRNTAYNPFTIEGKKTVSWEIYEQCNGVLPDVIYVPTGDGVIISGVYKGFEDLFMLGIIEAMPLIVAVQAEGSRNLIHNLNREIFEIIPSTTIADSISVDIPRNFFMARDYILHYGGESVIVSDEEILDASVELSKTTGLFAEPAATAAYAGYLKQKKEGHLLPNTNALVLLTGSGLKDISSVEKKAVIPSPVAKNMEALERFLKS
ncbi:pyridoxal-phosphate dependent enzyme [bacterium]|nr:pyridoxal-phosphate dependent enzyme [bacterium]